jgi:hypothetical protein
VGIVPNSVWDALQPPEICAGGDGRVRARQVGQHLLLSVVSGSWPNVIFGSRYNGQPVRSTGGYNELDLHPRPCTPPACASPPSRSAHDGLRRACRADGNNDTAWSATSNTGPCNTGAVAKSVSCANFVDCVGNLWERLAHHFDIGNSSNAYAWDAAVVNTGQDSAFSRGQVYHVAWRHALAGGLWSDGREVRLAHAPSACPSVVCQWPISACAAGQ